MIALAHSSALRMIGPLKTADGQIESSSLLDLLSGNATSSLRSQSATKRTADARGIRIASIQHLAAQSVLASGSDYGLKLSKITGVLRPE